jgi:hypothetical protein
MSGAAIARIGLLVLASIAGAGCGPMRLVAVEPLPPAPPLAPAARVMVLPPYEQTFSVGKTDGFEDKMLADAAASTGTAYPHSLRATYFTMFTDRLRARVGERGGPAVSLLPTALWAELERAPLKYVARGAENTSYGSAFRVPSRSWLRAHGVDADYLVAAANFMGGGYIEHAMRGHERIGQPFSVRLMASMRLMVWDTQQERMVAATTVMRDVTGDIVTSEVWREMAVGAADDIAKSRIFGGPAQPAIYIPGPGTDPDLYVNPPP